jgi:predicted amino acid dehydrogenase
MPVVQLTTTYERPEMEQRPLQRKNVSYVVAADGNPHTPSGLPTSNTRRWDRWCWRWSRASFHLRSLAVAIRWRLRSFSAGSEQFKLSVRRLFEGHVFSITAGPAITRASNNLRVRTIRGRLCRVLFCSSPVIAFTIRTHAAQHCTSR